MESLEEAAVRFSFQIAEQPFSPDASGWSGESTTRERSDRVKVHTTRFRQAATGLTVEEERLAFPESPAMEWVLRLREVRNDLRLLDETQSEAVFARTRDVFDKLRTDTWLKTTGCVMPLAAAKRTGK